MVATNARSTPQAQELHVHSRLPSPPCVLTCASLRVLCCARGSVVNPTLLMTLVVLMAVGGYLFLYHTQPIVIANRRISDSEKLTAYGSGQTGT